MPLPPPWRYQPLWLVSDGLILEIYFDFFKGVKSPSSIMSVMCPVASVRLLFQLDDKTSLHTTDNGEVVLRLTMLSLQTAPVGMRTVPMFDYQSKHLLRTKYVRSLNSQRSHTKTAVKNGVFYQCHKTIARIRGTWQHSMTSLRRLQAHSAGQGAQPGGDARDERQSRVTVDARHLVT